MNSVSTLTKIIVAFDHCLYPNLQVIAQVYVMSFLLLIKKTMVLNYDNLTSLIDSLASLSHDTQKNVVLVINSNMFSIPVLNLTQKNSANTEKNNCHTNNAKDKNLCSNMEII